MKRNFTRQIKFSRTFGDWTKLKIDKPLVAPGYLGVDNPNFDALSGDTVRELHNLHYHFLNELLDQFNTDLELKTQTRSIDAYQVYAEDSAELFDKAAIHFQIKIPQYGSLAVLLDSTATAAILNRLMGGKGSPAQKSHFTEIECEIINHYMDSVKQIIQDLWPCLNQNTILETLTSTELQEQLDGFSKNGSYVVFEACYDFNTSDEQKISLVYPTSTLNQLLSQSDKVHTVTKPNILLNQTTLSQVRLPISVSLGSTTVDMRDISNLQVGDIVQLDSSLSEPILATVGGHIKLTGQVLQRDGKYTFSLLEQLKYPTEKTKLTYVKSSTIPELSNLAPSFTNDAIATTPDEIASEVSLSHIESSFVQDELSKYGDQAAISDPSNSINDEFHETNLTEFHEIEELEETPANSYDTVASDSDENSLFDDTITSLDNEDHGDELETLDLEDTLDDDDDFSWDDLDDI